MMSRTAYLSSTPNRLENPAAQPALAKASLLRAQILMTLSTFAMAGANVIERVIVVRIEPLVAAFISTLTTALICMVLALPSFAAACSAKSGRRAGLPRPDLLKYFVFAGMSGQVVGTYALLCAIRLGGVAVAIPVVQTWSVWAVLLSVFVFREPISSQLIGGIALAVSGIGVISARHYTGVSFTGDWPAAVPWALAASLGWAVSSLLIKMGQARGVSRPVGLLVQYVSATLALGLVMLGGRVTFEGISPGDILGLCLAAVLSGVVAMSLLYAALSTGRMSRVILINAGYPAFASILAWLVLGDTIDVATGVGIVLLGLACLWVLGEGRGPEGSGRPES